MGTVKYMWVNIWCMLGWVFGLEERNFLGIVTQLVSAQNKALLWLAGMALLWLAGMNYAKIQTLCKA